MHRQLNQLLRQKLYIYYNLPVLLLDQTLKTPKLLKKGVKINIARSKYEQFLTLILF